MEGKNYDQWKIKEGDPLYNNGPENLSNSNLLNYLLKDSNSTDKLLYELGTLSQLNTIDINQLEKIIGRDHAETIISAIELNKRFRSAADYPKIRNSNDFYKYYKNQLSNQIYEEAHVALLNSKHRLIGTKKISEGDIDVAAIYPRKIFHYAVSNLAATIIFSHNHPGGSSKPSSNDEKITLKLIRAGKMLNIDVLDHIIFSSKDYYSFKDSNPGIFDKEEYI